MSEKRVWARVELDGAGSWLIEPETLGVLYDADIRDAIDGDGDGLESRWIITLEALTDEEYESLPEFDGY